jgi:WD40 repeat protein/serine/threonine protein kinase
MTEAALQRGAPVRRESLLALLWPGYAERSARQSLRTNLSYLKKGISDGEGEERPPLLLSDNQTIQINPAASYQLDLNTFIDLLQDSEIHQHDDRVDCPQCLEHLQQAVALYRDDFLCDFYLPDTTAFEDWASARRAELRRLVLEALHTLTAAAMQRNDLVAATQYARRQLSIDNLRESAHRQLIEILVLDGQRTEALAQYELCRTLLAKELGAVPSPKTEALHEKIRAAELGTAILQVDQIRGYQLREEIGAGAFGVVHRAFQTAVGREVAIKIIQPRFANHPDFIRRFEIEAQTVARLEHPHIVPLYDYWREPGKAYLVMRWLRGGSLADGLAQGPFALEATISMVDQIASALAAAHRQGVVHRDIKPANILLDEEGNAYLSDFGIAKDLAGQELLTEAGVIVASPAYASPEQVLGEEVTPLTDLYSLGMVLYQMLVGSHPWADQPATTQLYKQAHEPLPSVSQLRPELPAAVDDVIQRATAKQAADRYLDTQALAAALRRALSDDVVVPAEIITTPRRERSNPYRGLQPFRESDAEQFFGREEFVAQLLDRFTPSSLQPIDLSPAAGRFLAIVGPSGSGKSSVVRAGLLPALRRGGFEGSENWFITTMMPGSHPLRELEAALLKVAVDPLPGLLETLQQDEHGLARIVSRILPEGEEHLLLVIDQFEELFTQVETKEARDHFLQNLLVALADPRGRLWLTVTLRADFYDRPLQHPELGQLLRQQTELLLPLTPAELERAIHEPAAMEGVEFEPGLVTAIISDVNEQPGALPLLQYTLTELFERLDGSTMTLATYEELGGVMGALGRRAEEIYQALDELSQEATRQLFLRLVTLGEGVEDTRRRTLRSEVESLPATLPQQQRNPMEQVIDLFGRYRLLTFDLDPETRGPTVEVAHEALLREWQRLRDWLNESRHDIHMQQMLAHAAMEWQGAGEDASYLLRGARLEQFDGWSAETGLALSSGEQTFLDASLESRQQRQAEEESRRQRELETARQLAETEHQRAEEQTQAARRLRRNAIFLAGALVVAAILAVLAISASRQSDLNAQEARANSQLAASREAEAVSEANRRATAEAMAMGEVQQRATAQAVAESEAEARATQEAMALSERDRAEAESQARATAQADAEAQRHAALLQASIGLGSQASLELKGSFPERSTLLAIEALQNYPYTWQAERALGTAVFENHLRLVLNHDSWINNSSWSPDGARIATASDDGTAKVWDSLSGQLLFTFEYDDWVPGALWSPTGDRLLIPVTDGTSDVWDATTGDLLLTLDGHEETVYFADWSPSGNHILTASSDTTAKVWDATTGEELHTLSGHEGWVFACSTRGWCNAETSAWSPSGNQLLTRGLDNIIIAWDPFSGTELFRLLAHQERIRSVSWSPAGDQLLTASYDGTAKTWDAETGEERLTLAGHTSRLNGALWSPSGDRIVTFGWDNVAKVWDASTGQELVTFSRHNQAVWIASWSGDGQTIATGSGDGTAKLWHAATGEELNTFFGHTADVMDVKWSPSGTSITTAGPDGSAKVWNIADQMKLLEIAGADGGAHVAVWSPTDERIARSYVDGRVKLFDAQTGQEIRVLAAHDGFIDGLAWSPSGGQLLSTGRDGSAKVWDTTNGELLLTLLGHEGSLVGGDWSPDGKKIATAGAEDGSVILWDSATGERLLTFSEHSNKVSSVQWSPDGSRIGSVGAVTTIKIWDPESGQVLLDLYPEGLNTQVTIFAWSADGSRFATHAGDGLLRVWDAATGEELSAIPGHGAGVWTLSWFPSGDQILSADTNGFVKVWHVSSGAELFSIQLPNNAGAWLSSDATNFLTYAVPNGPVRIYSIWQSRQELIEFAKACCLIRELTAEERELFGLLVEP